MRRRQFLKASSVAPVGLLASSAAAMQVDAARKVVAERQREIPISHEADVIVVGGTQGGLGGCFAAIAAARAGAKTIFVEEHGHIDLHVPIGLGPVIGVSGWKPSIQEGLFRDLAATIVETGQHATRPMTLDEVLARGELIVRYHEVVATALLKMMQDAGVEMLFHTRLTGAVVQDGSVKAVVVHSPQGRHALAGKVFVDSTGLAELTAAAGAALVREEPYMGLQAYLAQVDEQRFNTWSRENDTPLDASHRVWLESIVGPFEKLEHPWDQWWPEFLGQRYGPGFVRQAMRAHAKGELVLLQRRHEKGVLAIPEGLKTDTDIARPRTYITGIDPLNVDDVSWAEVTSRLMLAQFHRFLKAYIPGFEHCVIERIADSIGLRGGRHLDVPDWPQSRFGRAAKADDAIFVMKKGKDDVVEIPFAALLPAGVEGLLVVGKTTAGGRTLGTAHVVLFQGQAAGAAAAIAARQNIAPRRVDIKQLQKALKDSGVELP
jgi:ribulose 1,5-bisphosphate synthetase/thiazole synthase